MDFHQILPKVRTFFLRPWKLGIWDIRGTFVHLEVLGEDPIKDVVLFVRCFKGKQKSNSSRIRYLIDSSALFCSASVFNQLPPWLNSAIKSLLWCWKLHVSVSTEHWGNSKGLSSYKCSPPSITPIRTRGTHIVGISHPPPTLGQSACRPATT